jgi:carboxypeptidase C (cathepsin A)
MSENNPSTDPVVLWLNGGPGCSSLDGFFYEHGPFVINTTDYSQLLLREYRWSRVANILYLESPVGVGFSYSDNPSVDYKCNDNQTANDNLAALNTFYGLFPEYLPNELYITGESYAGIYVPTLAYAVMQATKNGTYKGANLRGIAVGNGCTGNSIGICGNEGQATFYEWTFLDQLSFLPISMKDTMNQVCNWTAIYNNALPGLQCDAQLAQAKYLLNDINLYDVYDDCVNSPESTQKVRAPHKSLFFNPENPPMYGPDACIDSYAASAYLNQPVVMTAIHVRNPGFQWAVCADAPGWTYSRTVQNEPRDYYPSLIQNYRVLIYNGDFDACVPYTDNEGWTQNMGYPILSEWHSWHYTSSAGNPYQVAGYAVSYKTGSSNSNSAFEFITVRGAGHMVPEYTPDKAFDMITRVVRGQTF